MTPAEDDPQPTISAEVIALQPQREGRDIDAAVEGGSVRSGRPDSMRLPAATAEVLTALVARVALGDRGAFRALFELSRSSVFGLCLRLLRNRGEAEEVLQDVFVRIWRNAASYRGDRGQPLAWILMIARNRCLEVLRRRGVDDGEWSDEEADAMTDDRPTPEQDAMHAETARSIVECLRALEPAQRQAIELAYYDGLSYAEAAVQLARPVGTVKSQIRRGLIRLKRCLQQP